MGDSRKGYFKLTKISQLTDLKVGDEISRSDLCLQDGNHIAQFEFIEPEEKDKYLVKPGTWELVPKLGSVQLSKVELHQRALLMSITNARPLLEEVGRFHSKLEIYKELGRPPRRSILMFSDPGMGKSSTITHFCNERIKTEPGTAVIIWPTSKVESDDVSDFFASSCKFSEECTNIILVIEDIGGGEVEGNSAPRQSDSGMLNFLDGIKITFKLPTFIVATTNFPQNLLGQLVDRPGRFDTVIELKSPQAEDRVNLVEFISKRSLSDDEKKLVSSNSMNGLSIAHLEEMVIRSRLHDKTYAEVIKEILAHRDRVKNQFNTKSKFGFNDEI
jgi:hypothetical protein